MTRRDKHSGEAKRGGGRGGEWDEEDLERKGGRGDSHGKVMKQ